jgi:hypothetical protein
MLAGEGDGSPKPFKKDRESSDLFSPSFAPRGVPKSRLKFRQKLPPPLQLAIPQNKAVEIIHDTCSVGYPTPGRYCHALITVSFQKAVNSRLGRADNARFLERFRYLIVASQLLNAHSQLGQAPSGRSKDISIPMPDTSGLATLTHEGVALTSSFAFGLAWTVNWVRGDHAIGQTLVYFGVLGLLGIIAYAYVRRQWLQYLRQQNLRDITSLVAKSHELDSAASGALSLVQEVELVARGYKMCVVLFERYPRANLK